jgi:hypothetical protein
LNIYRVIALFIFTINLTAQNQLVKGFIFESDSITPLPFVYIINKSNGNGTMSDNEGKFSLYSDRNDTLICSYVGYLKAYVPVKNLRPDEKGLVKVIMTQMLINLSQVTVTTFKYKPYERDYMNKVIDESKIRTLSYFQSPISALYMQYSKEGRQMRKLAKIFENILIEEKVNQKLSPEILAKLTGDSSIDYEAFRKFCYTLSNDYIFYHDGAELYSRVMDCYKRWKSEGR